MSKILKRSGNNVFFTGESLYKKPQEESLFLSLGHQVDLYFPTHKKTCVSVPFIFASDNVQQEKQVSIDILPDECIFEIFRRLPADQEKSVCACVSKRWLMLLSTIRRDELCDSASSTIESDKVKSADSSNDGSQDTENDGFLSRCLEGKKATDVRLAAIAVGSSGQGGLGKLSIRGSVSASKLSNFGLTAISRGCPSLKSLSLWGVSSIGDAGLIDVAYGCQMLEKLDLSHCPTLTDNALVAIAKGCHRLTDLKIESCPNIGNECLKALGQFCPNLKSISIINCALIQDQGIISLFSAASHVLMKVKLESLNITDMSLAVIGHYGMAVTDLVICGLPNVTEKGFWVMGNGHGLQKLTSLAVTCCPGATDIGIGAVGKGCPNLKQITLRKCAMLSDNGMVTLAKNAGALVSLQIEECHRITQMGLFGTIFSCGGKLKGLTLAKCLGIKDAIVGLPSECPRKSIKSLSIRNCPGFGNASLTILAKLCPQLQNLDFSGCPGITDAGLRPLVESLPAGLVKVNLNGCTNVTDAVISTLAESHGWTLEMINLCGTKITDASLLLIADGCVLLSELDISNCAVTDFGIAALAQHLNLQILSVSGCSMLSDRSLSSLVKIGQTLLGLNIQHCNGISCNKVGILTEKLWGCDILA
uniref:EIN3-binding F-box protein 1 n=1 Tax=Kalanchoe fedtschenkoi TaxID=63787 RepID=A0A7N0ZT70_KALFE